MDDRTKGIGDESVTGFGDDDVIGRSDVTTPRRPTSTASTAGRTRTRSDERPRGAAGIVEQNEATEERTEQIRAEIEQTREDLSETIDAIQDRLRPRNIAANAAAGVRDAASGAAATVRSAASETMEEVADSRVVREVRSNPIPAVMVGVGIVGLAWLAFGGRHARPRRRRTVEMFDHGTSVGYYERDDYYRKPESDRSVYESAAGIAADTGARAGKYAREVGTRARQTTRRAQNQLQRAVNENPLFVGAAALAVGAMIGMALPETEPENELMGETRDNVVEGAQQMARTAATRVQEIATDAANRVTDVVSDPAALTSKDQ